MVFSTNRAQSIGMCAEMKSTRMLSTVTHVTLEHSHNGTATMEWGSNRVGSAILLTLQGHQASIGHLQGGLPT